MCPGVVFSGNSHVLSMHNLSWNHSSGLDKGDSLNCSLSELLHPAPKSCLPAPPHFSQCRAKGAASTLISWEQMPGELCLLWQLLGCTFRSVFSGCLPVLCTPMALPHRLEQACRMCQCAGWTLTHGQSMDGKPCHAPINAWFSLLCEFFPPTLNKSNKR